MKPRARRVTIAAAVLGAGVIGLLVVVHWGTARNHVEAWYFQLTRQTLMINPGELKDGETKAMIVDPHNTFLLYFITSFLDRSMIFSPRSVGHVPSSGTKLSRFNEIMGANGYRVIEQRFPRRAYVVIRDEHASQHIQDLEVNSTGVIPRVPPPAK